ELGTYTFNVFFFSSRRRHTRCYRDWSSDVCSSDLLDQAKPVVWKIRRQFDGAFKMLPGLGSTADASKRRRIPVKHSQSAIRACEIGRASCRERGWMWGGAGA